MSSKLATVPFEQESGGGRNLFVLAAQLERALRACTPYVDGVEETIGARDWESVKAKICLITETLLESWMIQNWRSLSFHFVVAAIREPDALLILSSEVWTPLGTAHPSVAFPESTRGRTLVAGGC